MAETCADARSQRRSNEAKKELASMGFKRRTIERIDPGPYLRSAQMPLPQFEPLLQVLVVLTRSICIKLLLQPVVCIVFGMLPEMACTRDWGAHIDGRFSHLPAGLASGRESQPSLASCHLVNETQ